MISEDQVNLLKGKIIYNLFVDKGHFVVVCGDQPEHMIDLDGNCILSIPLASGNALCNVEECAPEILT